ncbi:hypothetical protein EJB05_10823, partial [Eragrostis curvula]
MGCAQGKCCLPRNQRRGSGGAAGRGGGRGGWPGGHGGATLGCAAVPGAGLVAMYQDPRDACSAIAAESYKLWLEHENRTDDITIIIVHIRDSENSGPAGSDKVDYSIGGASIAVHTVQSEVPVFVASEVSHLNRCAATELQSSSSGSPTERSRSCVVPCPTQPLLHGRISDVAKPMQGERTVSHPAETWHHMEGGTELKQSLQRSIPPASC